jgi:hypothetical protein
VTAAPATAPNRAPLKLRRDDFYPTPPAVVRALLAVEELPQPPEKILEPFAGRGAIVDELRIAGHDVIASDLIDYGIPNQHARWDFLMEWRAPPGVTLILSNPPYKIAADVVEHALTLCPCVIMVLRTLFLESQGRQKLLRRHCTRVHVFSDRIDGMHRDGWTGKRSSPRMSLAWFCCAKRVRASPRSIGFPRATSEAPKSEPREVNNDVAWRDADQGNRRSPGSASSS